LLKCNIKQNAAVTEIRYGGFLGFITIVAVCCRYKKTAVCRALFLVILSAQHERIRIPLKKKRVAAHLTAVSPAGSVGASASQRCPPDTRTAMTGRHLQPNH